MIRPIDMQMLLPRTESVGNTMQHEITHSENVNTNAANEAAKQEQKMSETVVEKQEKQFDTYQYDAKDGGNGSYSNSKKKKKTANDSDEDELIVEVAGENIENSELDFKESQPRINFHI